MTELETKLKRYLTDNGIRSPWLAEKTQINYQRLLRILKGSEPTLSEAFAISRELNRDVHDLFEIELAQAETG